MGNRLILLVIFISTALIACSKGQTKVGIKDTSNVIGSVKYHYVEIDWEIKRGNDEPSLYKSINRNKLSELYTGKDKNGKWLAIIVPSIYLEDKSFGLSLIFIRSNNKWKFSYMRPVRLVRKSKDNYYWQDIINFSIPIKDTDKWKLKSTNDHHFYFEYNGSINIDKYMWIKKIRIKGISIPALGR